MFVLGDTFDLWNRSDVWHIISPFKLIWDQPWGPVFVRTAAQYLAPFGAGTVLGPINMYTYRTPDFLISSAQDYNGKN